MIRNLIVILILSAHWPALAFDKTRPYEAEVKAQCETLGLDLDFVHAVIKVESNYNHQALSKAGAMGLMQLMPGTADDLGVNNPFNPAENIKGGCQYLKYLSDKLNNKTLILSAYNSGVSYLKKYKRVPEIPETKAYIRKVMKQYNQFKQQDRLVFSTSSNEGREGYGIPKCPPECDTDPNVFNENKR